MSRPISEAQRTACQQNAQHSTGPRTDAGKAKARLNAVKHGLTAKLPVLPFEKAEDFEALRDGFLNDFAPQSTYQKFLVTQLATHAWRILRSQQVEIGLQELTLKNVIANLEAGGHSVENALKTNPYAGLALALQPSKSDPHNQLHLNFFRYTRQIQSDFHRTARVLKQTLKEPTTSRFVSPSQATQPTQSNEATGSNVEGAQARPANSRFSVETFTFSPSLINNGTFSSSPVSSRHTLFPLPLDVSPLTPGSA